MATPTHDHLTAYEALADFIEKNENVSYRPTSYVVHTTRQ
jgi:hypothetical protein